MARTSRGRELTERHRLDQVALSHSLTQALVELFYRLVVYHEVVETAEIFARAATGVVLGHRQKSRELSLAYVERFAAVEAPYDAIPVFNVPEDDVSIEGIQEQLQVAVRVAVKQTTKRGYAEEDSMAAAAKSAVGKGVKLSQDGGRKVLEEYTNGQNGPVGYARVVDADPCPFCAMLASRGVSYTGGDDGAGLYRTDSFVASNARFIGDGKFKVHDHCGCTLEPVYRVNGKIRLPGNGDQLAREWAEIAAGDPDPMGAWRRWRVSGTLPEDYDGPLDGKRRRRPPVSGQREGEGSKSKPAKKSERAGGKSQWDREDYLQHVGDLRSRLIGVEAEIEQMRARGNGDDEIALLSMIRQQKALVSRIAKYQSYAENMKDA